MQRMLEGDRTLAAINVLAPITRIASGNYRAGAYILSTNVDLTLMVRRITLPTVLFKPMASDVRFLSALHRRIQ